MVLEQKCRKITLPVFKKINLCESTDIGATPFAGYNDIYFKMLHGPSLITDALVPVQCNLFPLIVTSTGEIWEPAFLYLSYRIFDLNQTEMTTHHNVADDLVRFKQYLDEKNLSFDNFDSQNSYELPTYRYRNALQKQFENGQIAATTARRRMQSVIAFYRYLLKNEIVVPKNRPWVNQTISLHLKDERGFARSRTIETSDLRIKANRQTDPWSLTVDDGGKLRPLAWEEQVALINGLLTMANPEMLLIHLIALFTGARIQSILTLRVSHFSSRIENDDGSIKIKMGRGTNIDTKNGKEFSLIFPGWLYDKLATYSQSERAINRLQKASKETPDQYLFLTKFGQPYYTSKEERNNFLPNRKTKTYSNGQEIRKFKCGLIKEVRKNEAFKSFYYRFHDLRATFGMNLTDAQLALVEAKKISLPRAREYVKFRMCHNSYAVTDRYLEFRSNIEFTRNVRDAYGEHLDQLRAIVMDKLP